MAKISQKEIKLRKARKAIAEATPYNSAVSLFTRLQSAPAHAAVVGLIVAEVLKSIKLGIAPKQDLARFVISVCNSKQLLIHKLYPNALPAPIPLPALMIESMQIMCNANLLDGAKADLVPTLKGDKISVDINTNVGEIKVTDDGLKIIELADSYSNVFNSSVQFADNFSYLALDLANKIVIKNDPNAKVVETKEETVADTKTTDKKKVVKRTRTKKEESDTQTSDKKTTTRKSTRKTVKADDSSENTEDKPKRTRKKAESSDSETEVKKVTRRRTTKKADTQKAE